jgi:hypothetical protein
MVKVAFIILFFPIFIMIINGKPFFRPMPGLIHQTLNKILTKQINERFRTKSIVEPTNMPILVTSKPKLTSTKSNLLNKIPTKQTNEKSIVKSTVEPIRLTIRIPTFKFELDFTKSNPSGGLQSKILKTGKLPTVVLQSKPGFQLMTQLTESRQFKSTESTPNPLSAGPKSTVSQTKLPIILKSKSGFLTSPNFPELTETRKFSPEPTSNPKTSPIRSTTKDTQNDLNAIESTKSELNSRKHQITRAKSEKLSMPQARYKIRKPKKMKKCHLQFFEKCNFDEWSRFLNSN